MKIDFKLLWQIWVVAIIGHTDRNAYKPAEKVAYTLRTIFVLINLIACIFLIVNVIHHW